jgi:hypothetical protein
VGGEPLAEDARHDN